MTIFASHGGELRPDRRRSLLWAAIGLSIAAGQALGQGYTTGFESPTFNASPEGVSISGQDSWFTPDVAGSIDGRVFQYLGNSFGIPVHIQGGDQFLASRSEGGSSVARSQREGIEFPAVAVITYDVLAAYSGAVPAAQNLGSFSLQPEPNSAMPMTRSFIQLSTWVDVNNPTSWNAGYLMYSADGVQGGQPGLFAGPEWQNLSLNTWYRLSTTVDFELNRITEVSITDLATGETTTAAPVDWFLGGGASSTLPNPSGVRFFVGGGLGNTMALDNLSITEPRPACPCNWNGDDAVNSQDFFDFLDGFFASDADFNGDDVTNSQDFFDFLECFFAPPMGC